MIRIPLEYFHGDRACPDVHPKGGVTGGAHRGNRGQRVVRSHLVVFGVFLVQTAHGFHIANLALGDTSFAPQRLDRLQKALFQIRGGFRKPFFRRCSQPLQHRTRRIQILVTEERMVVAETLTPVGHSEVRVQLLCRLEFGDGLLPSEAVQNGGTTQEPCLRFG